MSHTPWDDAFRDLFKASPQAFVNLIALGARVIGIKQQRLKTWKLESDNYLIVEMEGKECLIN